MINAHRLAARILCKLGVHDYSPTIRKPLPPVNGFPHPVLLRRRCRRCDLLDWSIERDSLKGNTNATPA